MPLVDPKVFQEFWEERQRARGGREASSPSDGHVLRVETVKGKKTAGRRPWSAVEKGKRGGGASVVAGGSAANLRALRAQKRSAWSRSAGKQRSGKRSKGPRPMSAQPRLPTAAAGVGQNRRRHEGRTSSSGGGGGGSSSSSNSTRGATRGLGRATKRAASTSALTKTRPGSRLSSSESEKLFKLKYGGVGGAEEEKVVSRVGSGGRPDET